MTILNKLKFEGFYDFILPVNPDANLYVLFSAIDDNVLFSFPDFDFVKSNFFGKSGCDAVPDEERHVLGRRDSLAIAKPRNVEIKVFVIKRLHD